MVRLLLAVALGLAGLSGTAIAQTGNLVANGGFESPVITSSGRELDPGTGLLSWVISVDSIRLNRYASGAAEGSQWLDLEGDGGTISQTLATLPGRTYTLTFKYSTQIGSTPAVTVKWGQSGSPSFTERFSVTADKGWVMAVRQVTATANSTVLSFTSNGDGNKNYGVQLDAVSVIPAGPVDQLPLAISGPASLTYGTTGTYVASGGSGTGAVTYSAGGSTGCAVGASTGTVTVTNASGTCAITATKAGDTGYNPASATAVVALVKAGQAALAITGPTSVAFGTPGAITTIGGSGNGVVSYSTGSSTGCTVGGASVTVVDAGNTTCVLVATKAGDDNYNATASAPFVVGLPQGFGTPALVRVVSTGGSAVTVYGRVDGAAGIPSTLQLYAASGCTNGQLVGGAPVGGALAFTPDSYGYFSAQLAAGVAPGAFVAAMVTTPDRTPLSACLASSGDNDNWPKALRLSGATPTAALSARDFLDTPGRARWYKFDVLPGQRITVSLSGLPADYDLAVFKDIGATFSKLLGLTTTPELTRLSAEYAPSAFSPSAFSPSAFSPSAFSPSAFSPSAFSPEAFSPSVYSPSAFSPSAFSPSAFSPSAFSPSAFSPSAFSPSAFSPSAFSPSAFSPSTFSPDEFSKAFSSAQTRSIIGVSAAPGNGNELVVVNTWNNTGSFYVRVAGSGGAYSTGSQFRVDITRGDTGCAAVIDPRVAVPNDTGLDWSPRTSAAAASLMSVILTDSSTVALGTTMSDGRTLAAKLATFAGRTEVAGAIVDVADDARVQWLKAQATANAACPYATNLVAEEIKSIVDSYRKNNPGLRYVVIAGNDDAIPFFRYPDQSLLGQESGYVPPVRSTSISDASLRLDYTLSQDAYGAGTRVSLRTSDYPVPGLAVGRLVETPAEIAGMIDAYTGTDGVVVPRSSLVTGYDFLADAAAAVSTELYKGTNTSVDSLVTANGISPQDERSWTAVDLAGKLFGSRHDVIFLAGHFSANSALAADFSTNLITTDLAASSVDMINSIVFSAGCHSGYNLVDAAAIPGITLPLDWAQAFAQKRATLIAGTGYQYGDTDFLEYSERLYANFSRQLRAGTGRVAIGEALVKAKIDYLATTPDVRGIHEKALLEATLFGLPMLGVDMPAGRGDVAGPGPGVTPQSVGTHPAASLGLKTADLNIAPSLTPSSLVLTSVEPPLNTVTASWLSGPDGVVSNPVEPVLPLVVRNATATDPSVVLRGVGFRGGTYADSTVVPLTGAATTELRGVHVPFVSPVFFPMRPWTINYYGALGGNGATSLLITPVQHRAADIAQSQSTRREYSDLTLRLYYSGNLGAAAMSDAPSIVSVIALPSGGGVEFTAQIIADPAAAVHEAWITYTDGSGAWTPLDLVQCGSSAPTVCGTTQDSSIWKARLSSVPGNLRYVIQAASGFGLVTFDDNRGVYYGLGGSAQTGTTLAFVGTPPASAKFGDNVTVTVALASNGTPLTGKNVTVAIGGAARVGMTDGSGQATVTVPAVTVPGNYMIVGSFAGDDALLGSATSAAVQVQQATSNLAALTVVNVTSSTLGATLTATLGSKVQPLMQESVKFTLTGAAGSRTVYSITDYLGRAFLPPTGLPAGTYSLTATWPGNATYAPATSAAQNFVIAAQEITFGGAGLPNSIAYPGSSTFTVTSNASQPVTVGITPASTAYCSLDGTAAPTYTLTALLPGTCTLFASAAGTVTYADVTVTQDIPILQGTQTVAFGPVSDITWGDPAPVIAVTGGASNAAVVVTSQSPSVCTVAGTTLSIVGAGTCTLTGDQAGNAWWAAAPTATLSFAVNPRAITVTADAKSKAYGSADPLLTYRITSGSLVGTDGFSGTLTRNPGEDVGAYAILQGSLNLGANYALTYAGADVTIGKAATTTTVAVANATYDGGAHGGTASVTGPNGLNQTLTVTYIGAGATTYAASTTAPTAAGSYIASATYAESANYLGSSGSKLFTIAAATTTTVLVPSASSVAFGQSVTLTATVTAPSTGTLTGAITFKDGAATLGTATVAGGTAVYIANTLAVGAHSLTAVYAGDANDAGSTSAPVSVTISKVATATVLTADKASTGYGAAVNLTATVTPATATGTVTFLDGATTLGTGTLDSLGKATFAASALSVGTHTLTAAYGGDANDASSTSAPITVKINAIFTTTGSMAQPRSDHTATLLNDGRVLVAGGFDLSGASTATSEVYCPVSMAVPTASLCQNGVGKFSTTGTLPSKSAGHTATLLANGKVLATGGGNSSAELFDPMTNSWATKSGFSSVRSYHTATRLANGNVLFTGGAGNSGSTLNSTIIYNAATGTFFSGPNMTAARERHTATLLSNGKVLIAGGRASGGSSDDSDDVRYAVLNSAEIYDPVANTFTAASNMMSRHDSHAAALLANGKVLVAGGGNGTSTSTTAEVYDPATNTWAATGPLNTARKGHTFTVLANGTVLVAGGRNPTGRLDSAELYDPALGTFQPVTSVMTAYRAAHTATLLPDGYVLVVGGTGGTTASGTKSINSAEVYGGPPRP